MAADNILISAKELAYQNEEKDKRAAELIIANQELAFQNEEKEKRAAELTIANIELAYQNKEKVKRAAELIAVNKELVTFNHISSHHLQEPLRKIAMFGKIIQDKEAANLSESGKYYFQRIVSASDNMQRMLQGLLSYAGVSSTEHVFEQTDINSLVQDVLKELAEDVSTARATIQLKGSCNLNVIPGQFRLLIYNMLCNSLKYSNPVIPPIITITCRVTSNDERFNHKIHLPEAAYNHIIIQDNGIGFDQQYNERIFNVFEKLDSNDPGSIGIGLAIVKKIVANHNGVITATGELNKGARFDIYIPC